MCEFHSAGREQAAAYCSAEACLYCMVLDMPGNVSASTVFCLSLNDGNSMGGGTGNNINCLLYFRAQETLLLYCNV